MTTSSDVVVRTSLLAVAWAVLLALAGAGFAALLWITLSPVSRAAAGLIFPDSTLREALVPTMLVLHQVPLQLPLDAGGSVQYSLAPLVALIALLGFAWLVGTVTRRRTAKWGHVQRSWFLGIATFTYAVFGALAGGVQSIVSGADARYFITAEPTAAALAFGVIGLLAAHCTLGRPASRRASSQTARDISAGVVAMLVVVLVASVAALVVNLVAAVDAPQDSTPRLSFAIAQFGDQGVLLVERAIGIRHSSGTALIAQSEVLPDGRLTSTWSLQSAGSRIAIAITWLALIVSVLFVSLRRPRIGRTWLLSHLVAASAMIATFLALHVAASTRMADRFARYAFPQSTLADVAALAALAIAGIAVIAALITYALRRRAIRRST